MQENTNKAIAVNTVVLYVKMAITTICALLTTRFALQALGNTDFGLYSVLGGIISFVAIFNTIMLSTSNRFIAVAIGKGDLEEANKQFNVCLAIHFLIAVVTIIFAIPIGDWYVHKFINYEGDIEVALMVYNISIIGSVISFIGVPYNGLLMAKERFIVFSLIEIGTSIIKLIIAYLLLSHFSNKLLIYTITLAFLTAVPTLAYWLVCKIQFSNIVKFKPVTETRRYREVFGFSAWVTIGAVAQIGKNQGAALVINAFFNTVMNTALGLANSINSYISLFAQNAIQPMAPQIVKSYASGNQQRSIDLLVMSTKFAFMMMLIISSPFLVAPDAIISVWLGTVPPYVALFTVLLIVDHLIQSLNSGISNIIFASGKIVLYQISVSTLNVLSIVLAFLVLKAGYPAYSLILSYISISIVKFFVIQWVFNKTIHIDNIILIKRSYIPSLLVVCFFLPILLLRGVINPFLLIVISLIYVSLLVIFVGLNGKERNYIIAMLKQIIRRH